MTGPPERLPASVEIDVDRPSVARVYDLLLGGKDNFEADRAFVRDELAPANSNLERLVRDNRAFLGRVVRCLAEEAGIRQFLDIGTGLPTADNVHQVAQRIAPDARIVYVDNDSAVLAHARALLTSTPEGFTGYIDADARRATTILHEATRLGLDFTQPVAVLFVAILHFLPDPAAADTVVAFQQALAPGSHVVISHGVQRPDFAAVAAAYQRHMNVGFLRTPDQIAGLFGDWEMVTPGLADLPDWRPDEPAPDRSAAGLFLGGVARKTYGARAPAPRRPSDHLHDSHSQRGRP
ncbi:SAM-dependent methyltransferase [Actinomadura roseirufa]|uniref:SAM-dependent methyltransferase n=1 Tax=Actinomadura roseirufa TaxID=2094049 RepID=UPI0013F15966|nr:SAM-dependent methyltransferase [Actinomadura roseirufa]